MSRYVREKQAAQSRTAAQITALLAGRVSFQDAVTAVVAKHSTFAWAFDPILRNRKIVGGNIWVVYGEADPEDFPEGWWCAMEGGFFRDSCGVEGSYTPEEAAKERCADLRYVLAPVELRDKILGYMPEYALAALLGCKGDLDDAAWPAAIASMGW